MAHGPRQGGLPVQWTGGSEGRVSREVMKIEIGHPYGGGQFDGFQLSGAKCMAKTLRPLRVDRQPLLNLRLSTVKQNNPDPFIFAVLAVSAYLLVGSMPLRASQVSDATRCRVVNLMPPFWRFWDAAKDQPQSAQLLQFDEMVVKEHPEVYRESVLGVGGNGPGPRIVDFLRGAPAKIAGMRKLSDSLEGDLPLYLSDFQKAFPDFSCKNPIYFLVSLGAFDGGVRSVNGYPALLFGVDVIARMHPQDELGALFDHELFHMYHRQITGVGGGRGDPLYRALWEEGLATYVSGVLNPRVGESAILGRPEDLAARAKPQLPQIAGELLQNIDSTSPDLYQTFFLGNSPRKDIPPRSGYYVGLLIARELGQTHSLQQLAKMNGESLRSTIRQMLQKMTH
jgi:hypothetical protein